MVAYSFRQAKLFISKDLKFLSIVLMINIFLLFLLSYIDSSLWSNTPELKISYTFAIGLLQACSIISLSVRIQKFVQTSQVESVVLSFRNGFYATPPTMLYGLLYGVMIVVGTFLLILPGIYISIVFFYAPFLAMFGIEGEDTILNESRKLAKNNMGITFLFLFLCLFTEFSALGISNLGEKEIFSTSIIFIFHFVNVSLSLSIQCWFCFYFFNLIKAKAT